MRIEIVVVNVGDGDAICIGLTRTDACCVIVVDGGRTGDIHKVYHELSGMLKRYGKNAPDLFIGTHFDNDHIAGLLPLLKKFTAYPSVLWMFDTSGFRPSMEALEAGNYHFSEKVLPSDADMSIGNEAGAAYEEMAEYVLETAKKEQEILEFARGNGWQVAAPIAGICSLANWPEIKLLGPTQDYYQSLFPAKMDSETLIHELLSDTANQIMANETDPCAVFQLEKSNISKINLSSVIFSIDMGEKKFLFTGDAGIQSFYNFADHKKILKDILWLKQPHHGSANNFNRVLLELMNPSHIAVSGNRHISDELVACLQSRCNDVRTTKAFDTLRYDFNFDLLL
jgi:beta-lactamase superfamily II metal-dependent hydrolase